MAKLLPNLSLAPTSNFVNINKEVMHAASVKFSALYRIGISMVLILRSYLPVWPSPAFRYRRKTPETKTESFGKLGLNFTVTCSGRVPLGALTGNIWTLLTGAIMEYKFNLISATILFG